MRSKQVTLWYCDHCNRRKFTRPAMEKHEAGCTANISRRCGHCEAAGNSTTPFHDLIVAIGSGTDAEFDALVDVAGGCPACIQTAVRWWREMTDTDYGQMDCGNHLFVEEHPYFDADDRVKINAWRYKAAAETFWADVNAARYENVAYDY